MFNKESNGDAFGIESNKNTPQKKNFLDYMWESLPVIMLLLAAITLLKNS